MGGNDRKQDSKIGDAYADFVFAELRKRERILVECKTREEQFAHGDALITGPDGVVRGLEVKFNSEAQRYQAYFIETEAQGYPGGIFARSDTFWFSMGDYVDWVCIARHKLIKLAATSTIKENAYKSGRGFTLPIVDAKAMAVDAMHWTQNEDAATRDAAHRELGRAIFRIQYDAMGHAIQ